MATSNLPPSPASASAPTAFKPIRSQRAFEEIAEQIRNELVQGRLGVGSRLPSERALAEQFGVSRNTLREALRSLEHAGLLRLQKGATGARKRAEQRRGRTEAVQREQTGQLQQGEAAHRP